MANMSVQDRLGLKPEWVAESYEQTGNIMQTAFALRISAATVSRILKKVGVKPDRHRLKGKSQIGKKSSPFWVWLQQHPELELSRYKVKELAQQSGCSIDTVRSFLRRHKRAREGRVHLKLPDLRRLSGTLQLEDGRYISLAAIQHYTAERNINSFTTTLKIKTTSGEDVEAILSDEGVFKKLEEGTWKIRS